MFLKHLLAASLLALLFSVSNAEQYDERTLSSPFIRQTSEYR